jgi:hypothetical protein
VADEEQAPTSLDIREWLELEQLPDFAFEAERWTECDCDRDALVEALGREVLDSYVDRRYLVRRLQKLGYDRLSAHVRDRILPPPGNTLTGDFGEVVSTLLLRRYKRVPGPSAAPALQGRAGWHSAAYRRRRIQVPRSVGPHGHPRQ